MYFCYAWGSWFYFGWFPTYLVKAAGFRTLLLLMAGIAVVTLGVVMLLPRTIDAGLGGAADDAAPGAAD